MVKPPRLTHEDGRSIQLDAADFVAAGGQGAVYRRGDVAYKLFHPAADMPPAAKLAELAAIGSPGVVSPRGRLFDPAGSVVGYEMRFIERGTAWAQLCTAAHRRRVAFSIHEGLALFDALAELVHRVHAAGCVVVDLSDTNVVVADGLPYLIDTDSWQTPSVAATAITPSIADPAHRAGTPFAPAHDWFAFAVITFAMLTGIHPFKGRHPTIKGLAARMAAGASVLDPLVSTPPSAAVGMVPTELRAWFANLFSGDHRDPPPRARDLARPPRLCGSQDRNAASFAYAEPPRLLVSTATALLAVTRTYLYVDRARAALPHRDIDAAGLLGSGTPYVVQRGTDGTVVLHTIGRSAQTLATSIRVDALQMTGDRIFARRRDQFFELQVRELGARVVAVPRSLGRVLPNASQLFDGVLIQRTPGRPRATLLGDGPGAPQVELPTLAQGCVVDACHHRGVLRILVAIAGRFDRHTIGTGESASPGTQCERDVSPTACKLVVQPDASILTCEYRGPSSGAPSHSIPPRHGESPASPDGLILHRGQVFTLSGVHLRHVTVRGAGN